MEFAISIWYCVISSFLFLSLPNKSTNLLEYKSKYSAWLFLLIGRIFFHTKFNDILYTFVVMDVKIIKNLNLTKEDFTICLELPLNVVKKEIKYDIFPTIEKKRIDGKKKVNIFFDGLKMFLYLVKRYLYRK